MKFQTMMMRNSLLLAAGVLAFSGARTSAQTQSESASAAQAPAVAARITQAIDETQLVRFKGGVHRLARPEFDKGPVSDSAPMSRMLLLLRRSMDQESVLTQLMVDQYNTNSPNYHKWLTPEQFGTQFGPADSDIQAVTTWLQSHGFQVAKVSKGKIAIEFSGTAAQVREAFHTEVHKFLVNGEMHLSNASDPQIPAALAPVIHGLAPLTDFRPKPTHHVAGEFTKVTSTGEVKSVKPEFSTSQGNFALGPTDFATIYNVGPLWTAGTDGTGQSIAIIGVSNINLQDVSDFRTLFGLPTGGAANTPIVVIDGADPGVVGGGAETEALLDVEWSGGVAKGAQIHFVTAADTDVAQGLFLAILHVLDNNSDPIMSLSFGDCEPNEGPNNTGFWEPVWEQAAAQGITVTVSSGDDGSAGCEDQNAPAPNPATTGLQVSGLASTPFNVAVGGTDFNDGGTLVNPTGTQSTYFSATNDPNTLASALSYIPETTWNQSCTNAFYGTNAETDCNAANNFNVVTVGASGGASHCFTLSGTTCSGGYAKPAYQSFISTAHGMPADGARDLPDVSLFASSGGPSSKSFYVVCQRDAVSGVSCNKSGSFSFLAVGGTSASTPSFAGIMALVNQLHGRQGNANFVLYKLAQMQYAAGTACNSVASPLPAGTCTFNDVTTGTIAMPCVRGSLNCTTNVGSDANGVLSGFATTAGYDLATGLGSVNAKNLVNNWATGTAAFTPTTVALTLSPTTGITAGGSVTVNITVTPTTATGDVSLVSNAATGDGVDGFALSSGKVVNGTTDQLTGGTYQVTARYGGDGTFAPSVSAPVTVTVGKAASTTVGAVLISIGGGNFANFASGAAPVTLFLSANINPTGNLLPTGTVNFVDTVGGVQSTVASNVAVSTAFEAFTFPGISTFAPGNHSIVATYSGDASFTGSTSAPVTFTITGTTNNPVPTITTISPTSATAGGAAFTLTINGTNFISSSKVTFGTNAGLVPTSVTATQIMVSIPATAIAVAGTPVVFVTNPSPGGGPSNSVNFTVNANTSSFTITVSPNPLTITTMPAAAGTFATGTSTITVHPVNGFVGAVTVNCPATAVLPSGMACPTVTIPSGTTTGTLTVKVSDPSTSLSAMAVPTTQNLWAVNLTPKRGGDKGWWTLSAETGFASMLLIFLPGRKRYRAAMGLGLVCVLSFTLGCGGGGGGGVVAVATTTQVSVTSTKVSNGTNVVFTIAVNSSVGANGQVQLMDGSNPVGGPVTVSNGAATIMNAGLAVGTHSIGAHYLGDSKTLQSTTAGVIGLTVTGTTPAVTITATSGSVTTTTPITITVN
jgi:hypothetical protein